MEVARLIIRWVLITIVGLLAFALVASLSAQENSIVTIVGEDGGIGQGVVVGNRGELDDGYLAVVATANHVAVGERLKAKFGDKESINGKVLVRDRDADLAIVLVWVPATVETIEIGEVNETCQVEFYRKGLLTNGRVSVLKGNQAFADAELSPGDSGGAVVKDGKLVGIISGGWFWHERGGKKVTWPARFGTGQRLKAMLESVK